MFDATKWPKKRSGSLASPETGRGPVKRGNSGYAHFAALPALLLLGGCFGIPGGSAVVPLNAVACTGFDADTKDLDARETVCLKELGKLASRKGNALSLKLDTGTTKAFYTDTAGCDTPKGPCVSYYLVGFYPTARTYLVYGQGYEGHDYTLVNLRTSGTKKVDEVPRLAPDGLTFLVKACDETGGPSCWISVGSMASADRPAIAWQRASYDADDWNFVRWIDKDRAALRIARQTERCPQGDCDAILKRTGGSWKVENLSPKSDAAKSGAPKSDTATYDPK